MYLISIFPVEYIRFKLSCQSFYSIICVSITVYIKLELTKISKIKKKGNSKTIIAVCIFYFTCILKNQNGYCCGSNIIYV